MRDRPIIPMQGAQNAVTPQGRPIIQLNPANQFPSTKNASFYIYEVPGSVNEAVNYGPAFADIDVGIPRPISKDVLSTRYKKNLEYVRKEVERADLSKHRMVFTEVAEDGSRKIVGSPVQGSEVGQKTFITFVSNEVLEQHGIDYKVQGGVSFKLTTDVSGGNSFADRIRDMMVKSGAVQAKTEAYEQMMQADNFIFINARRLVADQGPLGALKTTLHEIGHAFSNFSGIKEEQMSENVVKAYDEGGISGGISSIKKQVIGHALEEARAETFALGILNKQGLIGELTASSVDSSKSKAIQLKRLLSYADRPAFHSYTDRYFDKLGRALSSQEFSFEEMAAMDGLMEGSRAEISTAAHAAFHRNVIIPSEMQSTFEPLRKRLISNTYHGLVQEAKKNSNVDLEQQLKMMKDQLSSMDEFELKLLMEGYDSSSVEELQTKLELAIRETHEAKIKTGLGAAQNYSETMSPIVGTPVDSLPKYAGGLSKDLNDMVNTFEASIKQNPIQDPKNIEMFKKILAKSRS